MPQNIAHRFLNNARCCVKELCFVSKKYTFAGHLELEEVAMNIKTNEHITVVNRETLVLKEDSVQKNFKPAVVEYVKHIARLQIGN